LLFIKQISTMQKILIAVLLLTAQFMNSQIKLPTPVRTIEGIKEFKCDNGLKVLLIEDPSQSNLLVNIVYHVGSRHEGYGETGMAHLLEHMLFKSCKKFKDIKKAIGDRGASANGTTWYDRTNYYEILPAADSNLKWAIEMEADRMLNAKILKEELEKEFSVVRNEFEIGENNPGGVINERIISTMYLWHNYGNSTIGSREDIERVPVENLRAFYKKYYQPDNATLIIAGKFDEKKALEYIAKNLSILPKPTRVLQPTYTVEPPQDGERYVELRRNGDERIVALAYHTPAGSDKDYIANDALIEILTAEGSGLLYKELMDSKLATSVYGYSMSLYDPGYTYFSMNIPMDKSIDEPKARMWKVLDGLPQTKFTEEQLQRAKASLTKQVDRSMSNTINFGIFLTEIIASGDYRLIYMYRDDIEKITLADLERVAAKYYRPSNRTWGQFIPDKTTDRVKVDERPDISALVKDYKGKQQTQTLQEFDASINNIKRNIVRGEIDGKLQFSVLKKPTKNNKIVGRIKIFAGDEQKLMHTDIAAMLLGSVLKSGTTSKNRTQIKDELDKLKSDINVGFGANFLSISISTDKDNMQAAMSLLKDILRNPSFNQNEFEKVVLENKTMYESYKNDPQNVAFTLLSVKTNAYPKGHPLGAMTIDEQIEGFSKANIQDVKDFYMNFIGLNEGYASFVGAVEPDAASQALKDIFSGWNAKTPYVKIKKLHKATTKQNETIQIDDKTNAVSAGTLNITLSEKDADFPAMYVANEILGGGAFLNSRIAQRLREAEGMSYGAGSFISADFEEKIGSFGTYAFFNPSFKEKLNSALLEELTKGSQGSFSTKELADIKGSQIQERKLGLGNNSFLASLFNRYMEQKKDLKYYDEFSDKIQKITLQEVNDAAKKYINMENFILIYSGDFKSKK
jgi:zinc protease